MPKTGAKGNERRLSRDRRWVSFGLVSADSARGFRFDGAVRRHGILFNRFHAPDILVAKRKIRILRPCPRETLSKAQRQSLETKETE